MNVTAGLGYKLHVFAVDVWDVTSSTAFDLRESKSVQNDLDVIVDKNSTSEIKSAKWPSASGASQAEISAALDWRKETNYGNVSAER